MILCRNGHEKPDNSPYRECARLRSARYLNAHRERINMTRASRRGQSGVCPNGHEKQRFGPCAACNKAASWPDAVHEVRMTVTFDQVQADVLAMRQRVQQRKKKATVA